MDLNNIFNNLKKIDILCLLRQLFFYGMSLYIETPFFVHLAADLHDDLMNKKTVNSTSKQCILLSTEIDHI